MRSEKVKYQICSIWREFGELSEGIFIFVIIINARNHCPVNFSTYYGKKLMDSDFVHCFEDRTIMKMPPEF